ncbi:hypothetical protein [Streptomyces sp. NPDC090083]|uniref:hypothetical protein n=1 Tax=Streptomyces sp. NPDC090083 TaxID=3365941 RepID=UPI0037FE2535
MSLLFSISRTCTIRARSRACSRSSSHSPRTTQNAIDWPEKYLSGTGDHFVSNEVVVQSLTATRVWHYLTIGEPAAALANERPNLMLNGLQAWLDGLIRAAGARTDA